MTTTADKTIQQVLNDSNLNWIPTLLQKMKLGNMLSPVKVTFTGLTGAATYDITSAALLAGASAISGLDRQTGEALPAILAVKTLRVTAASTSNSVGTYALTDTGGTVLSPTASSVVGLAKISDDGTTLTFATADVTAFVIEYVPRSATALTTVFKQNGI